MSERWPALMSRKDAAEYLGVSVSEIRNMKARGQIKSVLPRKGGDPKYRRSDLDQWIESLEYGDGKCPEPSEQFGS